MGMQRQKKLTSKLTLEQRTKRRERIANRVDARELRERAARQYLKFLYEGRW